MKLVAGIAFSLLAFGCLARAQDRSLDIYWVDVEGGGATLIVSPEGESLLIDAGEAVQRDASRIHQLATQVAGLKQIDHLVTTHWHSDHFGGVYGLSRLMPIRHFYANRAMPETLADMQGTPYAKMTSEYRQVVPKGPTILHPGDVLPLKQSGSGPKLTVRCLAANQQVIKGQGKPNPVCSKAQAAPIDSSENLNSLVLLLRYGNFTFFDSGDLTKNMEAKLVCPTDLVGRVTIFQSAHHGLDLSNNPVLIETIRPQVAVVNNSATKGAERETMATLHGTKGIETVWQVHRNFQPSAGWNTADEYIANTDQKVDRAQFIRASVKPDGSFFVQIGKDGNRKEYKAHGK